MMAVLRRLITSIFLATVGLGILCATGGSAAAQQENPVDLQAWDRFATSVETMLAENDVTQEELNAARKEVVKWRGRLLEAQGTNSARIATIQDQIRALGQAPAEGEAEPEEIAVRRQELNQQLAELQAPGLAAQEAHSRADGLVREIDARLRAIETSALLKVAPAPINPVNWPAGVTRLVETASTLHSEVAANWGLQENRDRMRANLPLIFGYLLFAALALVKGRRWIEVSAARMQQRTRSRGRALVAFAVSLGQIALPMIGVLALAESLKATAMFGPTGRELLAALPVAGFAVFSARWLGTRVFPSGDAPIETPLRLAPGRMTEGRLYSTLLGVLIGVDQLRRAVVSADDPGAAEAVIVFPLLVFLGLMLARIGMLLRRHARAEVEIPEDSGVLARVIGLIGGFSIVLGVAGPVFAAVGYVAAATAILYPAVISLWLIGVLLIVQQLFINVLAIVTRDDEGAENGLLPVLFAIVLILASIPVFALIWGARVVDILEVGARLQEGITIGESRISPADFLYFILVFVIVLAITRMVQGALRSSVLPKTKIDKGGSNAIVSGVGYIGIFLAGLFAFTSAGIDLSSLAIVAGALSVGIGFGLQNIVSNFVSGIILLIERPVSEGDWIEVGGQMGVVRAISVRSTRIETFDRTEVIVPNADLVSGTVTNWTKSNMNGRIKVPVGVAYGTDTRRVEKILREVIEEQPLVMMTPPPVVLFTGFGADSLDFEIRAILSDVNFGVTVKSDVNHEIARRFAEEGIEIPFGQRDIWLRNPEALGTALAPLSSGAPREGHVDETTRRADPSIGLMDDADGDGD
jgi:small-conductance mechanosensitive channel